MKRPPLIGITTSEQRFPEHDDRVPSDESTRREMALGFNYLDAILAAGGLPVVIPPLPPEAIGALLDGFSGVCLSGGPDIHPSAYGQHPDPHLGPTWPELDSAELKVVREAGTRELPLLAICRGAQILNVALGGTLVQHIPDRFGTEVDHRQRDIGSHPAHSLDIDPDSRLASVLGVTHTEVNSFHHQTTSELGTGLRAVACAPDGVIEAIESSGSRFVIGVQWHAEAMPDSAEQQRLFSGFVEAAAAYDGRWVHAAA